MSRNTPQLFTLDDNPQLGLKIAERLSIELSPVELRKFSDTEFKIRPLCSVRHRNVFVLASIAATPNHSVNDLLCRILFFCACLRDHGANSVYLLAPYLGYARKDRRTKSHDPLSLRYVAQLLETSGISGILCLDVHNDAAFSNAFRCPADILDSTQIFADRLAQLLTTPAVTLFSPDLGGIRRVERLGQALHTRHSIACNFGFIDKRRSQDIISGDRFVGEVTNQSVVIFDDLISTGTTIARTVRACRERGAREIFVAATHALFFEGVPKQIIEAPIDQVLLTNSLAWTLADSTTHRPPFEVLDTSEVWAQGIEAIQNTGSLNAPLID